MINRIEIDFALPVELTDAEHRLLDTVVQRIAKRHEPENMVHWCAGIGSKPRFSQADARFLGKPVDPHAPATGEPDFDDSVLYIETCARPSWPEEEARKMGDGATYPQSMNSTVCAEREMHEVRDFGAAIGQEFLYRRLRGTTAGRIRVAARRTILEATR